MEPVNPMADVLTALTAAATTVATNGQDARDSRQRVSSNRGSSSRESGENISHRVYRLHA